MIIFWLYSSSNTWNQSTQKILTKIFLPPKILVCHTAVFSVVTQWSWVGALRDDTKNGCVADHKNPEIENFKKSFRHLWHLKSGVPTLGSSHAEIQAKQNLVPRMFSFPNMAPIINGTSKNHVVTQDTQHCAHFIQISWNWCKIDLNLFTGKNNGFPFLDILRNLKNAHKNPKFGRVRQVPIWELGWEFPGWDLSHFAKFGIFIGIL